MRKLATGCPLTQCVSKEGFERAGGVSETAEETSGPGFSSGNMAESARSREHCSYTHRLQPQPAEDIELKAQYFILAKHSFRLNYDESFVSGKVAMLLSSSLTRRLVYGVSCRTVVV